MYCNTNGTFKQNPPILQGSDTDDVLLLLVTGALRQFIKALINSWNSTSTTWSSRITFVYPTVTTPVADVSTIDTMTYQELLTTRTNYKTAWDTLMPNLTQFVSDRLRSANNLFQWTTEPTGSSLSLTPSSSVKGAGQKTAPLVLTVPVVISGGRNMFGGYVVSDGGQTLTKRGIVYGTMSNVTFQPGNNIRIEPPTGTYSWANWGGAFSNNPVIAGLTVGSNYFARAFVEYTPTGGTATYSYGNAVPFVAVGTPSISFPTGFGLIVSSFEKSGTKHAWVEVQLR